MKKVIKKISLIIMFLFTCIVFTGCGGDTNSYDNAFRITVSKKIIDDKLAALDNSKSSRLAVDKTNVKMKFNDVEFPGHAFDSNGDYIFTKVMYESEAYKTASNKTSIIEFYITSDGGSNTTFATIEFEKQVPLPQNINISINNNGNIVMVGSNGSIDVYYYCGEPQEGLKKVKDISLEKINKLKAKVTFLNTLGDGVLIDYDYWKITAIKENNDSVTWTSSQNKSDKNLIIEEVKNGDSYYYTFTLSSKGEGLVGSHNLDNTSIIINEIKNDGKDVLSADILSRAHLL